MPKPEETAQVFNALVTNGLDHVEKSAAELEKEPKFSVGHFATGLEILLKARLFAEHWTLTASKPHECTWTGMKDGSFVSIQASDICGAVEKVTGTDLKRHRDAFQNVFKHRNRTLHWLPNDDVHLVAAEQCRAWYGLHHLLSGPWASYFAAYQVRLEAVDKSLLVHKAYLKTRYDEFSNHLKGLQAIGALVRCRACGFDAAAPDNPNDPISSLQCKVCLSSGNAARFPCGEWVLFEDLPSDCDSCGCHSKEYLLTTLGAEQTKLSCGQCFEFQAVVQMPDDKTLACTSCGARFTAKEISTCEYCCEEWIGYDTTESVWRGCEFCDGHQDLDDKD